MHAKNFAHTQAQSEKALFLTTVDFEAQQKQETKTKAEFLTVWLSIEGMLQQTYRAPWQTLRNVFIPGI